MNNAYYSPLLGTELRVIGQWLRVIDPATGAPLRIPEESEEALQQEIAARQAAEERERQAAEAHRREAAARRLAEERARQAEAVAAEERIRLERTEAQLEADRAELARLQALLGLESEKRE
jgi:hypothetical protein